MWVVIILFALGLVAAFPLAIGVCALGGWLLTVIDWRATRCPNCKGKRCMQGANGIRETYPTGAGTGHFYLCRVCGHRAFWSNDDRDWVDASHTDFNWAFQSIRLD